MYTQDTQDNDNLIDIARLWIDSKKGAYLAKENKIVYYTSITGRKGDYTWVKLSLKEVVRIITTNMLSPTAKKKLTDTHIITACQELNRVYDYGIKSNWKVDSNIFNYYTEVETNLGEKIMELLVKELHADNYTAILMNIVDDIFTNICYKLKVKVSSKERRELLIKHFQANGYEVRVGPHRPLVCGKKQKAVMMVGTKPRDIIVELSWEKIYSISYKIYGVLR